MYIVIKKNDEAVDEYSLDEEDMHNTWWNFWSWLLHKEYNQSGYSIEFK